MSYTPTLDPIFSGNVRVPTATAGDNGQRAASTAYVQTALGSYATVASPVFTGNPTAPTPAANDNDTSIATTAFVQTELADYLLLSGGTLTGPLTLAGAPTLGLHATTKGYVDSIAQGLDVKQSVRAASTASIANLSNASVVFDGVTLAAGDRVLVKNGASPNGIAAVSDTHNGIYEVGVVTTGTAALTRATDADANAEVTAGMFTFAAEGTTQADTGWVLTTNDPITVGTSALAFSQFSGAGSIDAGSGLTKSGNTLAVGQGTGITVNADDVAIDPSYVMTLGTNQTVTGTKTHTGTIFANGGLDSGGPSGYIYVHGGGDVYVQTALATTQAFAGQVVGDTADRFKIQGDGKIVWGSGAAVQDTNLYRLMADVLKTDDTFMVGGELYVTLTASFDANVISQVANPASQVIIGNVGAALAAGIEFGGDQVARIYRSAVSTLTTDAALVVQGKLQADAGVNYKTVTKTANYAVNVATDHIILVDTATAAGATTMTLPASHAEGDTVVIKDSGGQAETKNITIDPADADTIDGLTTFVIGVNYAGATLVSNGTNWFVM